MAVVTHFKSCSYDIPFKSYRGSNLGACFYFADSLQHISLRIDMAPPYLLLAAFRTWANAWPTTARLHAEVVASCRFGCSPPALDSLSHYLICPCLQRFWHAHLGYIPSEFEWMGLDGNPAAPRMMAAFFLAHGLLARRETSDAQAALSGTWRHLEDRT